MYFNQLCLMKHTYRIKGNALSDMTDIQLIKCITFFKILFLHHYKFKQIHNFILRGCLSYHIFKETYIFCCSPYWQGLTYFSHLRYSLVIQFSQILFVPRTDAGTNKWLNNLKMYTAECNSNMRRVLLCCFIIQRGQKQSSV